MSDSERHEAVDLCVIGGGINGAGVARDAAGRGYSVTLVEMGDIASATSSWSTKLIHGGLRYLEHNEFALVRASLIERARLLSVASHLVSPQRFILPHGSGMRPAWLIRLGLFVYDNLAMNRKVPGSKSVNLAKDPSGRVLKSELRTRGFSYFDCRVDDVRLTLANVQDAANRGASIKTHTKLIAADVRDGIWRLTLERQSDHSQYEVHAKHVVNTAGPWADRVAHILTGANDGIKLRLVRGSHIIIPRPANLDDAYLMQQPDGRVVFIIPYENDFALIGTTDEDHEDLAKVAITPEETDYLIEAANRYLETPIGETDIVWTYAGVRPLIDDGSDEAAKVTRDYKIETTRHLMAGLTNVFGGKLTTFRTLSQKVVDDLSAVTPPGKPGLDKGWTGYTPFDDAFVDDVSRQETHASVEAELAKVLSVSDTTVQAERLIRMYGRSAQSLAGIIARQNKAIMACGLFPHEVEHMVDHEWASTAEDILFRRCKLGIGLAENAIAEVDTLISTMRSDKRAA
ncbi:MAG: glycerol-3-phosphate dehydrogenase [Pseudomonadota bacterium]